MWWMKVISMYFSPTGGTKKIGEAIGEELAKQLSAEKITYDFTLSDKRKISYAFESSDIVVFGTPTIAGRVPNVLLKFLDTLEGHGAISIPYVCYGNRNYDDALIELGDILTAKGFENIACGAFIAEHSFSRILAAGRPYEKDLGEAKNFAEKIAEKIRNGERGIELPGNRPYRAYYKPIGHDGKPADIRKVTPKVNKELCIDCKVCAQVCPMGSIDYDDVTTMVGICIKCGACEKKCPTGAIFYDDPNYIKHRGELEEDYPMRKENLTCL